MNSATSGGEVFLRSILDAFPSPVLVVDADLAIHDANRAASTLVGATPEVVLRRLCGELLHCVHAVRSSNGCGGTTFCSDCVIREAATAACSGGQVFRKLYAMELETDGKVRTVHFRISGSPLDHDGRRLALLVLEDVTELVELRGLIPMCANCRKVRNDNQFWQHVESYLEENTSLKFTHGLCPDCVRELYPEIADAALE